MLGCFGGGNYGYNGQFSRASVATNPDGTQVASGVPRYGDGPFVGSKAVLIERGTTNYCSTPDLWNNSNITIGSSSMVQATFNIDGVQKKGITITQGVTTDIVGFNILTSTFPTSGLSAIRYTVSFSFKSNVLQSTYFKTQCRITVDGINYWAKADLSGWQTTITECSPRLNYTNVGSWQRCSYTLPPIPSGTTFSGFYPFYGGFYRTVGNVIYHIYDWMIEPLSYPTSFIVGTRQNENLSISQGALNPREGTVMFAWKPQQPKEGYVPTSSAYPCIIGIGTIGTGDHMRIWIQAKDMSFRVMRRGELSNWDIHTSLVNASTFDAWYDTTKWYKIAVRWSNYNTFAVFIDGIKYGDYISPSLMTSLSGMTVGANGSGNYHANSYFADLTIFNTALSDADIVVKQALSTPIPIELSTIVKCPFDGYLQSLV